MFRLLRSLLGASTPGMAPAGASCGQGDGCGCSSKRPVFAPPELIVRGREHLDAGRLRDALADFEEAVEALPSDYRSHAGLGMVLSCLGEHERAVISFTESLRQNSKQIDLFNRRGMSYMALGSFEEAATDFTKASRLDPLDPYSFLNRAICNIELEEVARAEADLEEAFQLLASPESGGDSGEDEEPGFTSELPVIAGSDSAESDVGVDLGWAYGIRARLRHRQQRYREAAADAQRSLQLRSGNAEVESLLQDCLSRAE